MNDAARSIADSLARIASALERLLSESPRCRRSHRRLPVAKVNLGLRDRVESYVAASARPITPQEVAGALGLPLPSVTTALSKAVAAGRLSRPSRGYYERPA
jgi:putative AbiEi antitoxin of type IV toxin-antitoxin system